MKKLLTLMFSSAVIVFGIYEYFVICGDCNIYVSSRIELLDLWPLYLGVLCMVGGFAVFGITLSSMIKE